jgi:3-deoxy-D-manno-octulosonic-acid transferase
MKAIYNLGIFIYSLLVWLLSPFNNKARNWTYGRKDWFEKLSAKITPGAKYFWIHCASLGEFEQGRPVIEAVKASRPDIKIVLTFFSPSGYEIRKNYKHADVICYLPSDTPRNAEKFVALVKPKRVIFVKYEFWNNYISELRRERIPFYLISGIFRKEQVFFKWYGAFFREILKKFTMIYVQDNHSLELLGSIGIENVSIAGDTRFDRVVQIARNAKSISQIGFFKGEELMVLAGSSWKQDEEIICTYINHYPGKVKWVFAPHEVNIGNIERLEKLISVNHVRFSQFSEAKCDARVMIIDNVGMLSSAYRYAYIAVVGGGFGKGIHNILEPASWGVPILFGPNHGKFKEAKDLLRTGGAESFDSYESFKAILDKLLDDKILYLKAAEEAGNYVKENTGATDKIIKEII